MSTNEQPAAMRDHWLWRPGWAVGRSFYTWFLTFNQQTELHQLATDFAPWLAGLPVFDPIPVRWLHLTTQGIGFTDQVDRADLDAIVHATRQRVAELRPFTVTVGPPQVDPEGLLMPVRPIEPLHQLRTTLRDAIADVWGADRVPDPAHGWRPHVTLAYSNAAGPAETIAKTLAEQPQRTAKIVVSSLSLIDLNRDHKAYEWTQVATVRLGEL